MTKASVRQQFADKLRRGVHALKFDEKFTAGKSIAKQEIVDRGKKLDDYADTMDVEDEALIIEYQQQAEAAVKLKKEKKGKQRKNKNKMKKKEKKEKREKKRKKKKKKRKKKKKKKKKEEKKKKK